MIMASTITKILFRQGLNAVRWINSVIFDNGEPAWAIDTKRLYVGDGVTIGGIPAGVKNLGTVTQLFSSLGPVSYNSTVLSIVSAAEIGDLIYDSTAVTLYNSTATNPAASAWKAYSFNNLSVSGGNGISVTSQSGVISAVLGPGFTVNDSSQLITLNYNTVIANAKSLTVGASLTAGGNIYAQGGNSQQWNSVYSTVETNSANWGNAYTTVVSNSSTWTYRGPIYLPQPITIAFSRAGIVGWGDFVNNVWSTDFLQNVGSSYTNTSAFSSTTPTLSAMVQLSAYSIGLPSTARSVVIEAEAANSGGGGFGRIYFRQSQNSPDMLMLACEGSAGASLPVMSQQGVFPLSASNLSSNGTFWIRKTASSVNNYWYARIIGYY